MKYDIIGKFIANLRKENNMTQLELAEKLGVTDRSVSNWENGKNLPDVSLYFKICQMFNISINELLEGKRKSTYIFKEGNNFLLEIMNLDKLFDITNEEQQKKIVDYLEKMNNIEIATINEKCPNIKKNYNLFDYFKVPLDFDSILIKTEELNRLKSEKEYVERCFNDSDISDQLEECYNSIIELVENSDF